MIERIVLIGAGNLASQLGKSLKVAGSHIVQVYSRTEKSARELAGILECSFTCDLTSLIECDLVIVAVKDDAIETVLKRLAVSRSILVHTAGSIPMSMLNAYSKNIGVFYPLQTFSKERDVDFSSIPICLEASSPKVFDLLQELAAKISDVVKSVNSEERKNLHLAAVFTCNFVNHFYHLGDLLLQEKGLDFDLLKPLIQETAQKVLSMKPLDAQTGPAIRFDETIINKHLDLLTDEPELKKIYSFVSESIYKTQKK